MKIVLLTVGKRHNADIVAAIDDYTTRLNRFVSTDWQLLPPAPGKTSPDESRRIESTAILSVLRPDDAVVLLDERGQEFTSVQFAQKLEDLLQRPVGRLVFVIGGAFGVTPQVAERAGLVWSLSKLVFPHQLVRLILAEQLYRAGTIVRGEPYHHQ